jgi:hypothetical protein
MDGQIFLAPGGTPSPFITVGGQCYQLVGNSTITPDTTSATPMTDCPTCMAAVCICPETATASSVNIAAGSICTPEGAPPFDKFTWESYEVALIGEECRWYGSPDTAPTNSEYTCTDADCDDCTYTGTDTIPEDFGAVLGLQTTPECLWELAIYGFAEAWVVRIETKPFDSGDPRGTYSGGSVVS